MSRTDSQAAIAEALAHHRQGRLDAAEILYRQVLARDPSAAIHGLLGDLCWQAGRRREAAAAYRAALALGPDAERATDLGAVLWEMGETDAAEAALRQALAWAPGHAAAHANLGNVLKDRGRLEDAVASYRRGLALQPDSAETHNNLGNALKEQGRLEAAVAAWRAALAQRPDFVQALNNLGVGLWTLGRLDEAEAALDRALALAPDYVTARNNRAALALARGDGRAALDMVLRALKTGGNARTRSLFVTAMRAVRETDPALRALLTRALTEPWSRPAELAQAVASVLRPMLVEDTAALGGNDLLCAFLGTVQNPDLGLERFFTRMRRRLLEGPQEDAASLVFYAALARQCFLNDYVFACDDAERRKAAALRDAVAAALVSGAPLPASQLLAVAAYGPLDTIPEAERLLDRAWPPPIALVLAQQVAAPRREAALRMAIPRLTAVADQVSQAVRAQYEENPYPRWDGAAPVEAEKTAAGYLARILPLAPLRRENLARLPDILIAGCGTGQQSIEAARRFPGASVLAVDLSLASLAYARRKAEELGLETITHAQADILELEGRHFDLIEASGVLHHLADPLAGWRRLLALLRPGGVMQLGFYSVLARRPLARARALLSARGFDADPDSIRAARSWLLDQDEEIAAALIAQPDFFGVSTCRDLLFHVQERDFTLAEIAAFLRQEGLAFLGFELASGVLEHYRRAFPDDPAAVDLGHWQAFEAAHPGTFSGMYQFWVQKPDGLEPPPIVL